MKSLLKLPKVSSLDQRLDLSGIEFTNLTQNLMPYMFPQIQNSLLNAQNVETIMNALSAAGVTSA